MRSSASIAAQQRFHRYVAVLFATTVPLVAVVELSRGFDASSAITWVRILWTLTLTVWAVIVARAPDPRATPLVLASMWFTGSLVVVEAYFSVEVTSFDFATTFGLMMLFAVLAGTLTVGHRMLWAGGLAVAVAAWVIVVGLLASDPVDAVGVRAVVAIAGVVFTTALVSQLYDQLSAAIQAYDRSRKLQDAVARCSEALLVHPDSFALHEAVRAVFEATESDYAYIDLTVDSDDGVGWEIVASASRGGFDSAATTWRTGSYDAIPTTHQAHLRGEEAVVYTADLSGTERELYEKDGILSELSVPIYVGDEFRGSIGFVEYTYDRRWTEDETQTLWRAADMIGAYWRRQDDAEALRASNESKDRLLASVSHEIRTPLTAIVGLSDTLVSQRYSMSDREVAELNSIIAVQSRELAELVEDLLVASRADFGNLSIRPEPVDLAEQITLVLDGLRETKPMSKSIVFTGQGGLAWADPLRVRQILRNLVTNAIKYGGDQIVVALKGDSEGTTVVVADSGHGIPETEAGLIFERYYRSEQSPTQPGSVGIGLNVSRQLAEMMGGGLTYVTGAVQHHFELTLPAVPAEVEALVTGSA